MGHKKFSEPVAISSAPPTDVSASAYSSSGGASTYSRSVLAARRNLGRLRVVVKRWKSGDSANCGFFVMRGRNCDPRLLDHKKFSEPGALSSPDPTNFRLPPTAYRIGLDLLASRARCKREARASAGERQDRGARRVRKLRLFLYTMACLRIASDALAVNSKVVPGRRDGGGWAAGNRKSMLRLRGPQEKRTHELHAKSEKRERGWTN